MSAAPGSTAEAVARAGDVAETVAAPLVARTDSGVWPADQLRALQQAGLAGLVFLVTTPFALKAYQNTKKEISDQNTFGSNRGEGEDEAA